MGRMDLLFDASNGRHRYGAIYLEKHAMMVSYCLKRVFFKDSEGICQAIKRGTNGKINRGIKKEERAKRKEERGKRGGSGRLNDVRR